jgi:hypothetical protein
MWKDTDSATALQAGRLWVPFLMGSLRSFITLIRPAPLWLLAVLGLLTEMSIWDLTWEIKAKNLATFMCRLFENPGSLRLLETSTPI